MPRLLRLIIFCLAACLTLLTAFLWVARTEPSQQREMILELEQKGLSVFYRFVPESRALTRLTEPIESVGTYQTLPNGSLLFSPTQSVQQGIFRLDFDTGKITSLRENYSNAIWSIGGLTPDQQWLQFSSEDDYYILHIEAGTFLHPTRNLLGNAIFPNRQVYFSPDGEWVTFTAGVNPLKYDVFVARRDGSELRNLTLLLDDDADVLGWVGANGGWILLRVNTDLYRIRPDGTGFEKLLTMPLNAYWRVQTWSDPQWADWVVMYGYGRTTDYQLIGLNLINPIERWVFPTDGTRLSTAFSRDNLLLYVQNNAMYHIQPNGQQQEKILDFPNGDFSLIYFSPGADWLLLTKYDALGDPEAFYSIRRDGSEFYRLVDLQEPTFGQISPDNHWVVYTQDRPRRGRNLFRVPLQGGLPTQLTDTPDFYSFTTWGQPIDKTWSPIILMAIAAGMITLASSLAIRLNLSIYKHQ